MRAFSTFEESQIVDRELRRRGIRKAIVVTSEFHTRRSRHIFLRHGSGEVEYIFAPSRTIGFDPDHWWQSRMGKKVVVQEWMKTLNSWWE